MAKALLCYVNFQANTSVEGEKPCKIFHFGGIAPMHLLRVKGVKVVPYTFVRRGVPVREYTYP